MKINSNRLQWVVLGAISIGLFGLLKWQSWQRPQTLPVPMPVGTGMELAVTRDGRYLVQSGTYPGSVFDLHTAKLHVEQFASHGSATRILPDSRTIVQIGYSDIVNGLYTSISLGDVTKLTHFRTFAREQVANKALACSPTTSEIATFNSQGELCFWDSKNGSLLRKWPGFQGKWPKDRLKAFIKQPPKNWKAAVGPPPNTLEFSPSGTVLAVGDWTALDYVVSEPGTTSDVALWDVASGRKIRDLPLPHGLKLIGPNTRDWSYVHCKNLVFSPDEKMLATDSRGQGVLIWDVKSGAVRHILHHLNTTGEPQKPNGAGVTFSPDSRLLAAAGDFGTVDVWEVSSGKLLRQYRASGPAVFLPDGSRLITGGENLRGNLMSWPVP